MRKNRKIVLVIIAVIVIGLAFVGGHAYAKYMSRVTGQGTADIASWNFKVNENEEKMQTISLKSTMNNSKIVKNKIAPGTEGSFEIKLDTTDSDVGVNYVIRFENESKKPRNLKFMYNGGIYNNLTDLGTVLNGTIDANTENKVKTIQIDWNWEYQTGNSENEVLASDIIDTQDAKQLNNYTFDIIVSGTQVNPAEAKVQN